MPVSLRIAFVAVLSLSVFAACGDDAGSSGDVDPTEGLLDGEPFDERAEAPADWGKTDVELPYDVPTDLPILVSPEVIVSLDGLTVHLFDRETGFSEVYPTGVGTLNSRGESITPTGHFATGSDPSNGWWYIPGRFEPSYFDGLPFLRLTALNRNGYATYGLHGPITSTLRRGYVSHGCMRMKADDIVRLFWLVRDHANTPVTIQKEVEVDAAGATVDVGTTPALYAIGEDIPYGASVGPRNAPAPVRAWVGDPCELDDDCDGDGAFCHGSGVCALPCAGFCPDRAGYAPTFCIEDPFAADVSGMCVQRADALNAYCADVPGSQADEVVRYVGDSGAPEVRATACIPVVESGT